MTFKVVDADERQVMGHGNRFGVHHAYQQTTDQSGTCGCGNAVKLVELKTSILHGLFDQGIHMVDLLRLFAVDITADRAAILTGLHHNTTLALYRVLRDRLAELREDQLDAHSLLALAEAELLGPLDIAASREVEAAARQVATVTALVPLALADVAAALTSNLRMIRRVAEIYGGRSGFFGSWRLTRAVLSHLVATGAVAVGDDMLEPILGGTMLAKLSRRFGEGLVNGALTARVGVAAMEVCRPMPFSQGRRPKVRSIIKRALSGLFGKGAQAQE